MAVALFILWGQPDRRSPAGGGPVGGVDQPVRLEGDLEPGLGLPAGDHGIGEAPVGLDIGPQGHADLVVGQRECVHPRR